MVSPFQYKKPHSLVCSATFEDDWSMKPTSIRQCSDQIQKKSLYLSDVLIIKDMRHNVSLKLATLFALFISLTACEKPNQEENTNKEKYSNCFVYDGYSFDIKSVVSYDAGDNLLEFWISSTEGLATADEIEAAGDYVVLNTHKSYLGKRDRFSGSTSDNSSIRFCNEGFKKGDNGNAYIEVTMDQEIVSLNFVAENLYTRASVPVKIKGNYSGTYVVDVEEKYSNEWGLERDRIQIADALYSAYETRKYDAATDASTYEVGKYAIALSSADGKTINIQFAANRINTSVTLPTKNDITDIVITYGDGKNFKLNNGIGLFSVKKDENGISVEVDIKTADSRIRAYYTGTCQTDRVKLNRYFYDYEGESVAEGWHSIAKLMVQGSASSSVKFYFSPSSGYNISNSNSTHMPILTVPSSIINAGKTYVKNLESWNLSYDLMQVSKYENEEKPYAGEEDWIEISKDGDTYTINLEITATSAYMMGSSLDIFYKGAASN